MDAAAARQYMVRSRRWIAERGCWPHQFGFDVGARGEILADGSSRGGSPALFILRISGRDSETTLAVMAFQHHAHRRCSPRDTNTWMMALARIREGVLTIAPAESPIRYQRLVRCSVSSASFGKEAVGALFICRYFPDELKPRALQWYPRKPRNSHRTTSSVLQRSR